MLAEADEVCRLGSGVHAFVSAVWIVGQSWGTGGEHGAIQCLVDGKQKKGNGICR